MSTPFEAPDIRTVTIPERADHAGWRSTTVSLIWECPTCGGPRGDAFESGSFDGPYRLTCDAWINPCGHIDPYSAIRREAGLATFIPDYDPAPPADPDVIRLAFDDITAGPIYSSDGESILVYQSGSEFATEWLPLKDVPGESAGQRLRQLIARIFGLTA